MKITVNFNMLARGGESCFLVEYLYTVNMAFAWPLFVKLVNKIYQNVYQKIRKYIYVN